MINSLNGLLNYNKSRERRFRSGTEKDLYQDFRWWFCYRSGSPMRDKSSISWIYEQAASI